MRGDNRNAGRTEAIKSEGNEVPPCNEEALYRGGNSKSYRWKKISPANNRSQMCRTGIACQTTYVAEPVIKNHQRNGTFNNVQCRLTEYFETIVYHVIFGYITMTTLVHN